MMRAIKFSQGTNEYCLCEDGNVYNVKTRHQLKWQSTGEEAPPRRVRLHNGDGTFEYFTKRQAREMWKEFYKEELYNEI